MNKFTNSPRHSSGSGRKFYQRDDRKSRPPRRYVNFKNLDHRIDTTADIMKTFDMRKVTRKSYEDNEHLLKRFKRVVENSGVMGELKKREFYQSKGQKKRDKIVKAQKRARKKKALMQQFDD